MWNPIACQFLRKLVQWFNDINTQLDTITVSIKCNGFSKNGFMGCSVWKKRCKSVTVFIENGKTREKLIKRCLLDFLGLQGEFLSLFCLSKSFYEGVNVYSPAPFASKSFSTTKYSEKGTKIHILDIFGPSEYLFTLFASYTLYSLDNFH